MQELGRPETTLMPTASGQFTLLESEISPERSQASRTIIDSFFGPSEGQEEPTKFIQE